MAGYSFDDMMQLNPGESGLQQPIRPLFTVNLENEEAVKKWLTNAYTGLVKADTQARDEMLENLRLYKGTILNKSRNSTSRQSEGDVLNQRIKDQKLYVNLIYDVVESAVAKITKFKPAVEILPANNDHNDRLASKVAKQVVDTIAYEEDFDSVKTRVERRKRIFGEDYVEVCWNPDKGDIAPEVQQAQKLGMTEVPIPGEAELEPLDGVIESDDGERLQVSEQIRTGDVELKLHAPYRVLNEPGRKTYEDVEWQIVIEHEDLDVLKMRYPAKADKIKSVGTDQTIVGYTENDLQRLQMQNRTILLTVYHKRSKFMPNGCMIKSLMGEVLKVSELPYEHDKLPLVRTTDLDIEEQLRGVSKLRNVKGLQFQHYNLSSMIIANQRLCSYPKWLLPQGSADLASLGNDRSVVSYRGPIAPTLVSPSTTRPEIFEMREGIKEELRIIYGGTGADRGEPPPGVTAAVALQFLAEQENERTNTDVQKSNQFTREVYELVLSVAGQYYPEDPERMRRILGKEGQFNADVFSQVNFNRPYNVRIQNANALSESKAAGIQTIIDLNDKFPGIFSKEQVVDMIQVGSRENFIDAATAAVKTAEAEMEDLINGAPVKPPETYEDLIVKWRVYFAAMQQRTFKDKVPDENRVMVIDHMRAIEMMMFEKAAKNSMFAQNMLALQNFPAVFEPTPPAPLAGDQVAAADMAPAPQAAPAMQAEAAPAEEEPLLS